ncbi:MAG TPA: surface-adhesin E family protein, partial [Gallionella sp.]|nr:surface-adhesin E family protein [Gallionella sp.]
TILSMVDLKKPATLSGGKAFLSWETQYEFDCSNRQSRIVAASMYSGKMGGGEVTDSVVYESPDWEAIPAGSNGEDLWKFACGKK